MIRVHVEAAHLTQRATIEGRRTRRTARSTKYPVLDQLTVFRRSYLCVGLTALCRHVAISRPCLSGKEPERAGQEKRYDADDRYAP